MKRKEKHVFLISYWILHQPCFQTLWRNYRLSSQTNVAHRLWYRTQTRFYISRITVSSIFTCNSGQALSHFFPHTPLSICLHIVFLPSEIRHNGFLVARWQVDTGIANSCSRYYWSLFDILFSPRRKQPCLDCWLLSASLAPYSWCVCFLVGPPVTY